MLNGGERTARGNRGRWVERLGPSALRLEGPGSEITVGLMRGVGKFFQQSER